MILIVKAPETLHLIEQTSKITGESGETVVAIAVREPLHVRDEAKAAIVRRTTWLPATLTQ